MSDDEDRKCDKSTDNEHGFSFCNEKDCPDKDADWGEGSMCRDSPDCKDDNTDDESKSESSSSSNDDTGE